MTRFGIFLAAALSMASFSFAERPNIPASIENEIPSRVLTLDSLSSIPEPVWPRPWHIYAAPGVTFDNNINHLLINSTVNSNIRSRDTIIQTEAGASYRPDYWSRLKPFVSYTFQRNDYQDHSGFSYYWHQLYAATDYWFTRRWAIDTGIEANWYADETGLVTDDQSLHLGLRYRKKRWRARGGYAIRRGAFIYSPGKDTWANSVYAEVSRYFWKRQLWYVYYDVRYNNAGDPIFEYVSHFVEAGWSNVWTKKFRVNWMASLLEKPYQAFDPRFGAQRHDRTMTFTAKPSYAFYPSLRLIGIYSYSHNTSNVNIKEFDDQLYSVILEARF